MRAMKTIDYYMSLPYRMGIIPDLEEGGYTAKFPDLPGCLTCAETIDDLVASAMDAKRVWLTAAIEGGIEIAEPDSDAVFPLIPDSSNPECQEACTGLSLSTLKKKAQA